jgi:hypothetical protein
MLQQQEQRHLPRVGRSASLISASGFAELVIEALEVSAWRGSPARDAIQDIN